MGLRYQARKIGNDEALVVPRAVAALLAQVLGFLTNGQGVQLMPEDAMLTTPQAADLSPSGSPRTHFLRFR